MPFFDDENILFIHIPKNAGMFIEKTLEINPSIFSYVSPVSKSILFKNRLKSALNYKNHYDFLRGNYELEKKFIYGNIGGGINYQHLSISEFLDYNFFKPEELLKMSILAVHRNPIDRVVSVYKYWGLNRFFSLEDFCINHINNSRIFINNIGLLGHLKTQYSFVKSDESIENKINWLSFDNLSDDLNSFLREKSILKQLPEVKINSSKPILLKLSERAVDSIKKRYEIDFVKFGYEL